MAKMTPVEEAAIALDRGTLRGHISRAARPEYDRLLTERLDAAVAAKAAQRIAPEDRSAGQANCGECGGELTPNARFCASCGESVNTTAQDVHCRECGGELTFNARFCASCGESVNTRRARRSSTIDNTSRSRATGEERLQEFTVRYASFADGVRHRLGASECMLTSRRLIIHDAKGGIRQILLRDISGISTPYMIMDPKTLRISLPAHTYDLTFNSKDQKYSVEALLSQAIRTSLA